jgi:hypothetical protein
MEAATVAMSRNVGGALEFVPSCTFADIRSAMRENAPDSPAALMVNSLLIPTEDRHIDGTQVMRFAHRVFQEFFLARAVVDDPERFAGLTLPASVGQWVDELSRD